MPLLLRAKTRGSNLQDRGSSYMLRDIPPGGSQDGSDRLILTNNNSGYQSEQGIKKTTKVEIKSSTKSPETDAHHNVFEIPSGKNEP